MKEQYFTSQNIDKIAQDMHYALKMFQKHNFSFEMEHSALLILDMQKFFLDECSHAYIPSGHAIIPKVQNLIQLFSQSNRPVIFTRHINTNENSGLMGKWWREILTEKNPLNEIMYPLNEIIDNFDILKYQTIIKSQYDAFYDTNLEGILKEKNIKQVVITGVMTHLCCETTARSAFIRGFQPFFVIDGTATYNEKFHASTLYNLAHGFAVPVLANDIMEKP